jgi:hypothetical protein
VGAHDDAVRHIEGILHVAGRVIPGQVQSLEIVEVGFHFRAGDGCKAQLIEDAADLFHDKGDGVQGAAPGHAAGHGGVEAGKGGFVGLGCQSEPAVFQKIGERCFHGVGRFAEGGAFFRRQLGQAAHKLGQRTLAAEIGGMQLFHL